MYCVAIVSVLYWYIYDDLRPYIALQVGVPIYILSQIYEDTRVKKYVIPIICSLLITRYVEHTDASVYAHTHKMISGHTLKHMGAGLTFYFTIQVLSTLHKI